MVLRYPHLLAIPFHILAPRSRRGGRLYLPDLASD